MADKHLQGTIFKHDGVSYLVLEDNEWDGDHLFVRSIDAARRTELLPRRLIEDEVQAQLERKAV